MKKCRKQIFLGSEDKVLTLIFLKYVFIKKLTYKALLKSRKEENILKLGVLEGKVYLTSQDFENRSLKPPRKMDAGNYLSF